MADIALTAAQIAPTDPLKAEIYPYVAAVALTAGQWVYQNSSGNVDLADANGATPLYRVIGMVTVGGGAGSSVSVIQRGRVYGLDVSGIAYGLPIFLSDTAGNAADTVSATLGIRLGLVCALTDAARTKVVMVDIPFNALAADTDA